MKRALFAVMLLVGACQGMEPGDSLPEAPLPEGFKAGARPQPSTDNHPPEIRMVEVKNGVETIKQAQTCYATDINPPWLCTLWGPTPPANFAYCGGDTNVYDGELVIFTNYNFGQWCFYSHPGPFFRDDTLGDLDGTWRIGSIKSNLHGYWRVFDGPYETYSYVPTAPGPYSNSHFTNFQISSLDARN